MVPGNVPKLVNFTYLRVLSLELWETILSDPGFSQLTELFL